MQPSGGHKNLLSEVIKKQIAILGPQITLSKARNVQGLTVADDGTVTEITGDPQLVTQAVINEFVALSGLIVKKTMESLLMDGLIPSGPVMQAEIQTQIPPAPQQAINDALNQSPVPIPSSPAQNPAAVGS